MSNEDDDDVPSLSTETFAALQEFYLEQEQRELNTQMCLESCKDINGITFEEDWQLSQFWYDDTTVNTLSKEVKKISGENTRIALISCPTLYKEIRKICANCEVCLFEYDRRFAIYGIDYHYYDYKSPLDIPRNFSSYFDVVVADPPFLSEECITKTAVTIRFLSKDKIILCTGSVMEDLVNRLLNLKMTSFKPLHRNNLANEFACYINYESDIGK